MNPTEKDHAITSHKVRIIKKFESLKWKENLILASQKLYAMLSCIETLLKQYPVRISLMVFMTSTLLFAYFQNEFTRNLAIASFGAIFVALTYRLGQANYHKNLFEERFAIFNVIDEVMREWARETKANREMIPRLDNIMRKSYCLFSVRTYQFIKDFRMSIITLAYCIESAPDRDAVKASRQFLINLVDNENLPKMFSELKIDSY